ncbi:hypothetical protein L4D12_25220 [Photobacterium nomapromontoriensis]
MTFKLTASSTGESYQYHDLGGKFEFIDDIKLTTPNINGQCLNINDSLTPKGWANYEGIRQRLAKRIKMVGYNREAMANCFYSV